MASVTSAQQALWGILVDLVTSAWGGIVREPRTASDEAANRNPLSRSVAMNDSIGTRETHRVSEVEKVAEGAKQLLANVTAVTFQEFHWQESHYDHDSRHGRELLFLIANHEWVRATSETIEISRSDSIDTAIKIDIDLDQITHEAFRKKTGLLWLPIAVLPPQPAVSALRESGRHRLEPDPFATVTTAAGDLLPLQPTADIRHQISAAMAEIIVNMGVARWPDADGERLTATRDQRLLLSAAIYRLLRQGSRSEQSLASRALAGESRVSVSASRIDNARSELTRLLRHYNDLLNQAVDELFTIHESNNPTSTEPPFTRELARRAVTILRALADSVLVVVPIDRDTQPTVLTVKVPSRNLNSPRVSKLVHPSTWMLRPLGYLDIDVLLPTADADRQVELRLPDGVSFEEAHPAEVHEMSLPRMDIDVEWPQPLRDLAALMEQILDPKQRQRPWPVKRCLADLASSKVASARETLRQYDVAAGEGTASASAHNRQTATSDARATLTRLYDILKQLYDIDDAAEPELENTWKRFEQEASFLCRRASAERPSPRIVVARAEMIEDVYQRATPNNAKICANIVVADSEYFSIARFSGRMSLLLMTVVLAFLAISRLTKLGAILSPEVLAIVLTLFSAIQAGQMEARDRSTVHGMLSAAGNWLIATSILPAVLLAVALAFSRDGWAPTIWAIICVSLQLLFQLAMLRGPLTPSGLPRAKQRRKFSTESLDYHPFEALRSDYWCSTTADALTIGQPAYAYVVWQKKRAENDTPQLKPLLAWKSNYPARDESANVLALLRAGTTGQAMTFVVFRQEPDKNWLDGATIAQPDFDPDRLAPMESITNVLDVFVGILKSEILTIANHPVTGILNAAARKLMVLEAQLPVPAPVGGYGRRQWARVRVGLRNAGDIKQLAPFLDEVNKLTATTGCNQSCVVAVQAAQTVAPRIITKSQERLVPESDLVLTSDLDITYPTANDERGDARTWRVLTFCSDARSNIESDIVNKLAEVTGQNLQLAGLTYALLHGMAIMSVITHEPEDYAASKEYLESELNRDAARRFQVLINEKLCRNELAPPARFPLLRVHFRWQDRPGAILNVLDSLSKTLNDQFPSINEQQWSVSYARTQAPAGRAAVARLTLRIHIAPDDLESWNPNNEEIERKVRARAALEALAGHHGNSAYKDRDIPEDPVISVNLIRTPPVIRDDF